MQSLETFFERIIRDGFTIGDPLSPSNLSYAVTMQLQPVIELLSGNAILKEISMLTVPLRSQI